MALKLAIRQHDDSLSGILRLGQPTIRDIVISEGRSLREENIRVEVLSRKRVRGRSHFSGVVSSDGASAVLAFANNDLDGLMRLDCDEQIRLSGFNLRA
jgi:hypothetical protein